MGRRPFDGTIPVETKVTAERVDQNGCSTIEVKIVVKKQAVKRFVDNNTAWQLPRGCLARNNSFQSAEGEIFRSVMTDDIDLVPLWGKLNACSTLEEIQVVENRWCNGCTGIKTVSTTGGTICEKLGETCAYYRLIQAAKAALESSKDGKKNSQ